MNAYRSRILWVLSLSLSRLAATAAFVFLAESSPRVATIVYLYAMVSDLLDGYLSRHLNAETRLGKVVDLTADKALTLVSLVYVSSLGLDVLPLAIIAIREVVMLGMRLITFNGEQVLATSRIFGGIMATLIWGATLLLIVHHGTAVYSSVANAVFWGCALVLGANLFWRVGSSASRISKLFER